MANVMINLTVRYLFIIVFTVCSCDKKTIDNGTQLEEIHQDTFAVFPLDSQMEFIGTSSNDQIAFSLKRETQDTFKYRIELLRKWKGMPFDSGTVQITKIDSDSTYYFSGGNAECDILIKIYKMNRKSPWVTVASLERKCKQDSMNIAIDEFPRMWNKSGRPY